MATASSGSISSRAIGFISSNPAPLALSILGCYACYWAVATIYNTYAHPLAKFPGPFSASFSNFTYCRRFLSGRQPYKLLDLHDKYGPVVRTAPNELSFNTANSWRDIYGQRKGHQPFIKSPFYDGGNFANAHEAHSLVSVRDPEEHNRLRKFLANVFSDRSLKEQEYLISEVVDAFVDQLGEKGKKMDGVNIVNYFNLTTFDIIGSLAFGQTFGGVESGDTHFWISIVIASLMKGALADCFNRFPVFATVFKAAFPGLLKKLTENTKKHEGYTIELVKKRMNMKTDRKDFFASMLESRELFNISDIQLAALASDFVIAGSETTATALSCVTYYLLKEPTITRKLQEEIRSSFETYEEITASSTAGLKYLQAVALEGMRLYPPLPFALPRVTPPGGDTVDGHFIPGGTIVSTAPLAACLSPKNFKNPWKFDPERWLGQNETDILEASQPFSTGIRGCLGRSLGWMELRTILAKMHFKYDFILCNPDLNWHRDSEMHTLWKKPDMIVRAIDRKI